MFICNFLAMELSIFGLLAIAYVAELATASVPMLVLVQNGVGAGILTPIISILIILGAISTAVNMISGIVTRCVNAMERRMDSKEKKAKGLSLIHIWLCRLRVLKSVRTWFRRYWNCRLYRLR